MRNLAFEPRRVRRTKWWQWALRFLFGGLVTAATGVVAKMFGPVVGGLFLAFPSILPASLTLLERQEQELVAGADTLGAIVGSAGLLVFGLVLWATAPWLPGWEVLALAMAAWLIVAIGLWFTIVTASRWRIQQDARHVVRR